MEQRTYIQVLWKWKKTLFFVLIVTLILSMLLTSSWILKPLYESTAVCYPINLQKYSDESPTEQMLQLFQSDDLFFALADSLNLYKHYRIDPVDPKAKEKLLKKLKKRIRFKRTPYESVKIYVRDENPQKAYNILIAFIEIYNRHTLQLLHQKAYKVLKIKQEQYLQKKHQVDSLSTLIDSLIQKHRVTEYNILRESVRGNYPALFNTSGGGLKDQQLGKASFQLFYYQKILENEIQLLAKLKEEYERAQIDTQKQLDFADIIESPIIPLKKAWPIRSVLILLSLFSTLMIASIVILIYESHKKLN